MAKKMARQEVLKIIISSMELARQEDLLAELTRRGYVCTQSTLSRDLRQLQVVKAQNQDGAYVYMLPRMGQYRRVSDQHVAESHVSDAGIRDVRFTGPLAVVRTLPGHASHVAYDIDRANSPLILGTIAGDDTVFAALAEDAQRADVLDAISLAVSSTQP